MPDLFNFGTNKQGLIVFGGESSADYGMVVSEPPAFERAARKQTVYKVPGKNGSVVIQQDAWDDVSRTYKVWLAQNSSMDIVTQVDAVEAWLNGFSGYQRLEDNFEPDVFRLAYYSGGDSFSNELMLAGEATLRFTCKPQRFYKNGEQTVSVSNGSKLYNETRFASKPLIHIEGSGTVGFGIGSKTITASITDYINIDCEEMNAFRLPNENKNSSISGPFPVLAPGYNTITITGTVTSATIIPRFFTI